MQVETTNLKGLTRIVTTVIGGVLGYLVMLDSDVASNPYGLMAIICALAFLCGLISLGDFKYAMFLLLITQGPPPSPGYELFTCHRTFCEPLRLATGLAALFNSSYRLPAWCVDNDTFALWYFL